jgi:hypothetical protein
MSDTESKDCFGKLWEEESPDCAGGLDPLYVNPVNGTKIRTRCVLYDECRRRMQASEQTKLSDIRFRSANGARPPTVTYSLPPTVPQVKPLIAQPPTTYSLQQKPTYTPPQAPPVQYAQPNLANTYIQHHPAQQQQSYNPPIQHAMTQAQPPSQYFPAVFHPTLNLQPHEAPPFLTVLEPAVPGEAPWKRMIYEALRAAAKGMLSHGVYMVDHIPIYQRGGQQRRSE